MRIKISLGLLAVAWAGIAKLSASWEEITQSYPGQHIGEVRTMASDGERLYIAGLSSVRVSSDNGETWTIIEKVNGSDFTIKQARFIRFVNGFIWVGVDPGSAAATQGAVALYRLTPGSQAWEPAVAEPTGTLIAGNVGNNSDDIAYDNSTGVYFLTSAGGNTIYTSTDGTHWTRNSEGIGGVQGLPSNVMAQNGIAFHNKITLIDAPAYVSTDNGSTWAGRATGFDPFRNYVFTADNTIVTATGTGAGAPGFRWSSDNGASWTVVPVTDISSMYLATQGNNILGAGKTTGFVFVPEFAIVESNLLQISTDSGRTWDAMNGDGIDRYIQPWEILIHGDHAFIKGITLDEALTNTGSLWRRPLSELGISGNNGGGDEPTTFEEFAAALPEGQRAPLDDANDNGIANLYEFAFAISDGDRSKLPKASLKTGAELGLAGDDAAKTFLTLEIRRNLNAQNLGLSSRFSATLADLQAGSTITPVGDPIPTGDGAETILYKATTAIEDADQGFLQLLISE